MKKRTQGNSNTLEKPNESRASEGKNPTQQEKALNSTLNLKSRVFRFHQLHPLGFSLSLSLSLSVINNGGNRSSPAAAILEDGVIR